MQNYKGPCETRNMSPSSQTSEHVLTTGNLDLPMDLLINPSSAMSVCQVELVGRAASHR